VQKNNQVTIEGERKKGVLRSRGENPGAWPRIFGTREGRKDKPGGGRNFASFTRGVGQMASMGILTTVLVQKPLKKRRKTLVGVETATSSGSPWWGERGLTINAKKKEAVKIRGVHSTWEFDLRKGGLRLSRKP